MARIAFIGAGSFGFTRTLVRDILTFATTKDAQIVLMDIDPERLAYITKAVKMIVAKGKYPAKVISTTNRKEALKGADAVICTILAGGVNVWRHDIEIPKKYGVDTNIGDTRGPSGIFRALRTIPVMLSICRDMERLCPDAILLNYTNPMAMLCHAMQRETSIKVSGLCHSVQGTAEMLARWIGAPMDEVTYVCAGINHTAWYLEFKRNGKDVYPEIRKAMEKPEIYNEEVVRNEMFKHLGYYVTESSGHNSEYNWWFRKRPDLIEKYCTQGTGWNPGVYGYVLDHYLDREQHWREDIRKYLKAGKVDLKRGKEYAAYIINAYLGGDMYEFNGNVPNTRHHHEPAGRRVRRGAGRCEQARLQRDPRRRPAAAVRDTQQGARRHRDDDRRGVRHRRPDDGVSRGVLRPALRVGAVACGNQEDGPGDAQQEQGTPADVQAIEDIADRP